MKPVMAVVGLGLIGGSVARALTRAGYTVIGVDRPAVARRARRTGAVARTAPSVERAASAADVVILAATPSANLRLLPRVARAAPEALVTDVGSVKGPIVRAAVSLGLRRFVGGHPMAGSERAGLGASDARLFRGRPWILTPVRASPRDLALLRRLVTVMGARPLTMRPAEHDRAVAFLSHVPQLAAWALRDAARADRTTARRLGVAGPGFRDMTRLARSPRGLWREILDQNRREVTRAVDAFVRELRRRRRS
jgi:prephenate dehydrogenase